MNLSRLSEPFDTIHKGKLAKRIYTLNEYNKFTAELMKLSMSYHTRIVRHKKKPTEYFVILLDSHGE